MLKNKNFALGTAALLLSTAGFTACSSEDTFSGSSFTGEAVKTQFAINIPVAKSSVNGRLSQEIVQGQEPTPTFRGMSKIKMIPFGSESLSGTTTLPANAIVLGDIASGASSLNKGAEFYTNVAVPVGTQKFLFYAEAKRADDATDKTNGAIVAPTEFDNGDLAHVGSGSLGDVTFNLKGIATVEEDETNIQNYLANKVLTDITKALVDNAGSDPALSLAAKNIQSLKAGSSQAILATIQNLYDIVKTNNGTHPNLNIAQAIVGSNSDGYFTDNGDGTLSFNKSAAGYVTNADNYPAYLGIPAGAAQVAYAGSQFTYQNTDAADFASYVYPAALCYYVQSAVGTTDAQLGEQNWTDDASEDWDAYLGKNYQGTAVTSTTQSIALKDPVQYAVAQMIYNVKFAKDELPDAEGVNRAVGSDNFQLTGILIGDQKAVDYQFNQKADADAKTIYDAEDATPIVSGTPSKNFYTLALQSAGGGSESVNFALEFKNNGDAFYGKNGLVPNGGTFYLTGTLTANKGTNQNGYVFKQDYKTTANITISSLKNAYYTVPDLRKTQLSLGLTVDLTWEAGLTDNVEIQ